MEDTYGYMTCVSDKYIYTKLNDEDVEKIKNAQGLFPVKNKKNYYAQPHTGLAAVLNQFRRELSASHLESMNLVIQTDDKSLNPSVDQMVASVENIIQLYKISLNSNKEVSFKKRN